MDIGFTRVFVEAASINSASTTRGTLIGSYQGQSDVLSVQYSQAF